MIVHCTECGYNSVYFFGDIIVYLSFAKTLQCMNCEFEMELDVQESMKYALDVWRN